MKQTAAQTALLHAAESLGVAALMSIIAALYQYFILHGFDVQGLIGVGSIGFIGALSMLYKSLSANPNLVPAINDTIKEVDARVTQLGASHLSLVAVVNALVQQQQQAPTPQPAVSRPQFTPVPVPTITNVPSIPYQATSTYPGNLPIVQPP